MPEPTKRLSKWYVQLGGHLLHALSRLPLWWLYRISDLIMPILYYVVRYRRRVVRENLERSFPNRSLVERRAIEWRFYRFFCDYAVETVKLLTISPEEMRRRMKFCGIEQMDAELDHQNFVFLMLGHYGNWEWISTLGMCSERHCGQLYRPLRDPVFDRLFFHLRSRFGSENISKYEALRHILHLRREVLRRPASTTGWNSSIRTRPSSPEPSASARKWGQRPISPMSPVRVVATMNATSSASLPT